MYKDIIGGLTNSANTKKNLLENSFLSTWSLQFLQDFLLEWEC